MTVCVAGAPDDISRFPPTGGPTAASRAWSRGCAGHAGLIGPPAGKPDTDEHELEPGRPDHRFTVLHQRDIPTILADETTGRTRLVRVDTDGSVSIAARV